MTAIRIFLILVLTTFTFTACKEAEKEPPREVPVLWESQDETAKLEAQQSHENQRMRYKLLQAKFSDKNEQFATLYWAVEDFPESRYNELKPLILEQDIPSIQNAIKEDMLTYEELVLFFLKRIYNYELDPATTLHTIIALNPTVLEEARERDATKNDKQHPIFGMPILLKDNISTTTMKTTAGAVALKENLPKKESFIVSQLKENGAILLGKVNLSEWAYYFCNGCPLGYSAIGGQTLNPYGRMIFETGGSSSGSGTSVAANYAVGAVGTETSGSIISPTSQNSLVGLKPTIGLLSRSGIVPISHTLDTPGPMTKNAIDAAILLDAMTGKDVEDDASVASEAITIETIKKGTLAGKRLGVMNRLLEDSIYAATIKILENNGAEIVRYDAPEVSLDGFLTLLNLEMRDDLPIYFQKYASENITVKNLEDVMALNRQDSLNYMPYDQGVFDGIMADSTSSADFEALRTRLQENGTKFFQQPMQEYELDAILSINNYHSGYAAVGKHPCLALPMGYKENGEPVAITLIGAPFSESELLQLGYAYEQLNPVRKIPALFKD